jgi:hypothetical protein
MVYEARAVKLKHPYIVAEEEFRCLVMNAMAHHHINCWDCRPTPCPDPMWIEGIPIKPRAGDIPFLFKGLY